jgi:alkylhydroperoxidase/carboxymuconolactone decarboxylase family protein YurZ
MWTNFRARNPRLARAFDRLFKPAGERHLSNADRELLLFGLYAARGSVAETTEHGRLSLAAGVRPEALEEVVLTAAISRGPRAIVTAKAFLSTMPSHHTYPERPDVANDPEAYFRAEFGAVPPWARRLAQSFPDSFASYALARAVLLTDGAASRATKELLTMCLNALDNTPGGVRSHGGAALRHGAGRDTVMEALLLTVPIGGIVGWITGVQALADLLEAPDAVSVPGADPAV